MIDQISFLHAPPSSRYINPDQKYPMNQGVNGTKIGPHPTFVNDTFMAEGRYLIRQASENSVLTESVFVGNSDLVKEPTSVEKIERFFTHLNKTLSVIANFRSMTDPTQTTRELLSWLYYIHRNGNQNLPTRSDSLQKF